MKLPKASYGELHFLHTSELGEFFLGGDAITHSFKNHK
jgi:hypothetical protein